MEIRSFLAFELPPEIKKTLSHISRSIRNTTLDVRYVKPDNIHLTLIFLGNIPTGFVKPIGEATEKVCQMYGPFAIKLNGIGVFSSRRNPRVLWVGIEGDVERMADFRETLQMCLIPFGIRQDKRCFRPHLTLGRFRKGAGTDPYLDDLLSTYRDLKTPVCMLERFVLFKSDLNPGGAVYSKMKEWVLTQKG